ncbi:hypothetical protein [endosymbiont GvMRE of Glomus versiforme]|uniref:hypothetical protein n=1 Tax=endosymbiont GvMRE of Glomus versiforme TaxID=2039283 RepID=UPI000ED28FA5|nr:hypothetical protein [endosymbiont GvMRE of Glomus versiforme]RHZ36530.1 hypothetical protein GvMRE_I2g227 [endosymbiont GvMRE of Glomus versiforme]
MNTELFTKELDEVTEKINKLEIQETEEDNSWKVWLWYGKNNWPNEKICLERRASWQSLKSEIERKINLIKEMQKSISIEEKNAYFLLINRYYDKLDKTERKLRKLEAHLANAKSQQITQWITLIIFGIMLIILVAFVLYYIVFKDKR